MADHFTGTPLPVPPEQLTEETRQLLVQVADDLDRVAPGAAMNSGIRLARPLVLAERLHGATVAAHLAEQDLLAAMPLVRDEQTRGEYAALLRLIAEGVTA
ncbi:hypothetical protein J3A78_003488 [Streptomyces sp. PvR006]|uniref:hypothetical protein n=1 Tax=Streptomyces sp. PvR006 TaxID=2817860 RepID=UPI001AE5EFD2|nr:hypothetical protein [Streptomyces sp. PvR006]MBP2583010.1 hypothetical protein [Streptomyces sp. PvR006]